MKLTKCIDTKKHLELADGQLNSTNTEGFWAVAVPGTTQTVTTDVPARAENQPGLSPTSPKSPGEEGWF